MKKDLKSFLKPYLPENCLDITVNLFEPYEVHIKITKPRATKLGDYRPGSKGELHRITINNDLNPYSFLITLVHELAHLVAWEDHGRRISPHGVEWKCIYSDLMSDYFGQAVFPQELESALVNYFNNPKATSCTDPALYKALRKYNENDSAITLDEIPENAVFSLHGKRFFVKGEKLRKRYLCKEYGSRKKYLIHGLAEVKLAERKAS